MSPLTLPIVLVAMLGQMDEVFEQDFREGRLHPALELFGPRSSRTFALDTRGLRITLPAKRRDPAAVGVSPRFRISGDFEITVTYEILSAQKPESGMGAGVQLWCAIGGEDPGAVLLGHLVNPRKDSAFVTIARGPPSEEEEPSSLKWFDATGKKGKIRLTRTDSILRFLVAEGATDEFREVRQADVGTEPLRTFRLSANTNNVPAAVSVRLIDLTVRADEMGGAAVQAQRSRSWVFWVMGLGLTTLVGVGILVWWRRSR